jgi:regulatory protein
MIITKITRQKSNKSRFSIFVDGKFLFSVTDETLYRSKLKEGSQLTKEIMENILVEENKKLAMNSAWKLLSYRPRSKKEIEDHLKRKHVSKEAIKKAIGKVEELGYLDDVKFAGEWSRYRKNQDKGPELIKKELRQKGIDSETIRDTIALNYKEASEEIEQIKKIAVKKMRIMKTLKPDVIFRRLVGFLSRRGFEINKIMEALKTLRKDFNPEEE